MLWCWGQRDAGFARTKTQIESVFLVTTERMYFFFLLLLDCKRLWRGSYASKCPGIFTPVLRPVVVCSCLFKGLYLYDLFSAEVEPSRPFPMSQCNQCRDTKFAIQSHKVNPGIAATSQRRFDSLHNSFNGLQTNHRTKAEIHDIIFFIGIYDLIWSKPEIRVGFTHWLHVPGLALNITSSMMNLHVNFWPSSRETLFTPGVNSGIASKMADDESVLAVTPEGAAWAPRRHSLLHYTVNYITQISPTSRCLLSFFKKISAACVRLRQRPALGFISEWNCWFTASLLKDWSLELFAMDVLILGVMERFQVVPNH